MGLDVSFSKEKAVAAGLHLYIGEPNGDAMEIRNAKDRGSYDFANWLEARPLLLYVPTAAHTVEYNEYVDDDSNTSLFVRANRWGNTYYPLTNWLIANNIEWDEG